MPNDALGEVRITWSCPRCGRRFVLADLWAHLEDAHGIQRSHDGTRWVKTPARMEQAS